MKHLAASAADIHLAGDSKELYAIKYGGKDNVHPSESGANLLAELFLCTVRARKLPVAACAAYEGPADTTGWTFEPAAEGLALAGDFRFADGALWLRMKGAGTMLLFR